MALILIANADRKFSDIIQRVLHAYGCEGVIARTGEEALQLFLQRPPALCLLDLGLLGKSGLEVLTEIRSKAPHLPVVICGSNQSIEIEDRARQLGVSDVLRRGLRMDIIMQAVQAALSLASHPDHFVPPLSALSTDKGNPPPTILIVDDEPEIGLMVGEFLRRRGYQIQTAVNGEQALDLIHAKPPDLVLLDIYMPGINGIEVLRRIQQSNPSIGVIMLTASQEEALLQTALDIGAFDVLCKPVNLDQLALAVTVKLAM